MSIKKIINSKENNLILNINLNDKKYIVSDNIGINYMHTNLVDNKKYAGENGGEECRWNGTLKGAIHCYNSHFHNAVRIYDEKNFKTEILLRGHNLEDRGFFEDYYIVVLDLRNPKKGYNMKEGGAHGKFSDEHKKKISIAKKGKKNSDKHNKNISESKKGNKNPMYGKHHTEEIRKKMGGNKDKKFSEETRKKMSDSKKGKKLSKETIKKMRDTKIKRKERDGYINSPETRKKMSESGKKKFFSEEHKNNLKKAYKKRKERDGYINSPETRKKRANSIKSLPEIFCPYCDKKYKYPKFLEKHIKKCSKNKKRKEV